MMFNLIKFQKFPNFFKFELLFLILINQFHLFKSLFKKYFFRKIRLNN